MNRNRKQRSPGLSVRKSRTRAGAGLTEVLVTVVILVLLAALFLPSIRRGPEIAHRSQCRNNLKQIGLALRNYLDEYGTLPPAFTVDANGKPLHSWRTLILPYLDQKELYESIDLTRPWDDPANARASAATVPVYTCPAAETSSGHTTYKGLVGPEFALHSAQPRRLEDFQDGISKSLLVVDVSPAESVHWMNPGDSANQFLFSFNEDSELSHSGGIQVVFADGKTSFLLTQTIKERRRALATIAAGDYTGESY